MQPVIIQPFLASTLWTGVSPFVTSSSVAIPISGVVTGPISTEALAASVKPWMMAQNVGTQNSAFRFADAGVYRPDVVKNVRWLLAADTPASAIGNPEAMASGIAAKVADAPKLIVLGDWIPVEIRAAVEERLDELAAIPIDRLDVSVRLANCLMTAGHSFLGSVLGTSHQELLKIRNFGRGAFSELAHVLQDVVAGMGGLPFASIISESITPSPGTVTPGLVPTVAIGRNSLGDGVWVFGGISAEQLAVLKQIPLNHPAPGKFDFLGIKLQGRLVSYVHDHGFTSLGDVLKKGPAEMIKVPHFGRKSLNELRDLLGAVIAKMSALDWSMEQLAASPAPTVPTRKNQDLPGNWIPEDLRGLVVKYQEALDDTSGTSYEHGVVTFKGIELTPWTGKAVMRKWWWSFQPFLTRSRRDLYMTGFRKANLDELTEVLRAVIEKMANKNK